MIKSYSHPSKMTVFDALVKIAKTVNPHFPEPTDKFVAALRCHFTDGKFRQSKIKIGADGPRSENRRITLSPEQKEQRKLYKKEILEAFSLLATEIVDQRIHAIWIEHDKKQKHFEGPEFVKAYSFRNALIETDYLVRYTKDKIHYGLFYVEKKDVGKYCKRLLKKKGPSHRQLIAKDVEVLGSLFDDALKAYKLAYGHAATSITIPPLGKFHDCYPLIVKQLQLKSNDKKEIAWQNIKTALLDILSTRGLGKQGGRKNEAQAKTQADFFNQFINIMKQ